MPKDARTIAASVGLRTFDEEVIVLVGTDEMR
jgi:hypothetical protein